MFHVQSPSDAIMSPCTKKINNGAQIRRPISSNPANILRYKQQNVIDFNIGDAAGKNESDTKVDNMGKDNKI